MNKILIIITGGPGTGKSYMTREVMEHIPRLEALSYDTIKEQNFDKFGYDNEEQKLRLNEFSLEEFYLQLQKEMWLSKNLLIEYPFYQRHIDRLSSLSEEYGYRILTIYLHGDLKVIYERGILRDSNDKRHLGHLTARFEQAEEVGNTDRKGASGSFDIFCA